MNIKEIPNESRVERKKEETKKKIITVAIQLFKKYGFDGTTMEQIAKEVDIAKGTLYNYFPVKEAIIDEYIQRTSKEKNSERILQLKNLPDTRSRMSKSFIELIEGVKLQKEFFEKYLVYRVQKMVSLQKDDSEKSGIELLATEIIILGQKSDEIRRDLPLHIMVDLFEFAFIEVVKQFYMKPEKFNAHLAIEQCVDLFINGVKH